MPDDNVHDFARGKPKHHGAALADLAALDPPPSALSVPPPAPGTDAPFELWLARQPRNDVGNSTRLLARHGCDLIWVRSIGWLAWDGRRWSSDEGEDRAALAAQETYRAMAGEVKALEAAGKLPGETDDQFKDRISSAWKWSVGSGNSGRLAGMIEQAAPRLARRPEALDAHPFLFNVANGTLELGERESDGTVSVRFRPHDRDDLITKVSPVAYDPEALDPTHWRALLDYFLPDRADQVFAQRWGGYNMTGSIIEQCILLLYGAGRNGKSTIVELLAWLFGGYAVGIPISSLTEAKLDKSGSEASPDLARLRGARMVRAAEPKRKATLAEGLIKQLTGGEDITARHLNKGFFEFKPTFKLTVSFNRKPKISGDDDGIWRRIRLLPFTRQIPEDQQDREFSDKLKAEGPAILNWLLDGYRLWRDSGLPQPRSVVQATLEFRAESDLIGPFLASACLITGKSEDVTTAADLWRAYLGWCARNGQPKMYQTGFGKRLTDRAGVTKENVGVIRYRGITLVDRSLLDLPQDGQRSAEASE